MPNLRTPGVRLFASDVLGSGIHLACLRVAVELVKQHGILFKEDGNGRVIGSQLLFSDL